MTFSLICDTRKRLLAGSMIALYFMFSIDMNRAVFAQQVYKWIDSNGKVQYGEKRSAPTTSKEVTIKPVAKTGMPSVKERTHESYMRDIEEGQKAHDKMMRNLSRAREDIAYRPVTMAKTEKWPEFKTVMPIKDNSNEKILALGEAILQNCVSLAVKMHDLGFGNDEPALRKQFLQTCPDVTVECSAYRKAPEKNVCEPKPMGPKKGITIFETNP